MGIAQKPHIVHRVDYLVIFIPRRTEIVGRIKQTNIFTQQQLFEPEFVKRQFFDLTSQRNGQNFVAKREVLLKQFGMLGLANYLNRMRPRRSENAGCQIIDVKCGTGKFFRQRQTIDAYKFVIRKFRQWFALKNMFFLFGLSIKLQQ